VRKYIWLLLALCCAPLACAEGAAKEVPPAAVKTAFAKAKMPLHGEKRSVKDFTLRTLDGQQTTLSALKGKVVFLNFWATWCGPCRSEMPSMEALYQRFKSDGLVFAAVDIMENEADVRAFVQHNSLTFPVVLDLDGKVSAAYNIQAVPSTFIIDRDNKILLTVVGARDWYAPAVVEAFTELVNHGQ
jgi:thiol-disulfide isomerase/thioredoxin